MAKIALVTGGMGGIGTAICQNLAANKYVVVTTNHNTDPIKVDKWQSEVQSAGVNIKIYKCDVTNFDECKKIIAKIQQEVGTIDILINNAGITRDTTLRKMTKDSWDSVIRTNLDGMFNVTRQVIDGMIEKGWGRIINISSINGQKGQFGQVNYSAAKAGVHGFTMSLAQEVARKSITVNTIAPGYIATDMVMNLDEEIRTKIISQIPMDRLGTPQEIAGLVAYLVSDLAGYITGAQISINGGQHMM